MDFSTLLRPRLLLGTAAVGMLSLMALAPACSDQAEQTFPVIDAGDVTPWDANRDTGPSYEVAVPIDLSGYIEARDTEATAQVYQVESDDQLANGPVAEARVGDWVLENDRVRLFVEGTDRAMSPCPWGGNIVDAEYKRSDGTVTEDVTGEICLMVNVGQTFAPEEFTVIEDGADGGPAILAVSGRLALLDFLNISAMANDYAPGILDNVALDPDEIVPAKLTRYLILHPGDNNVHVVTALQNDGDEPAHMAIGHLMRGGGHGNYFNPLNSLGGWGYRSLGADNLTGDTLPFVTYSGPKGGYGYLPKPDPRLFDDGEMPRGGVQVSVAGVTVSLLGRDNVLSTLVAQEETIKTLEGLYHLEPDEVGIIEHWEFFGDEKLNTMVDPIYEKLGVELATIQGEVTDSDGQPVAGAMVTAIDSENRGMNQTLTDDNGQYALQVPAGDYSVRARLDGRVSREDPAVSVVADAEGEANLVLKDPATINLTVQTPDDSPTPARVTIVCDGPCPDMPTSQERDVTLDSLPSTIARVVSVGVDGQATIQIPAGSYKVSVTRGMEWSVWPPTAASSGGQPVELAEGESIDLDAEIAKVVDSTGAISADFHVHGVTSPDSIVRKHDRVKNFMGEGVDVLISTDHDFISDYGPEIEAQNAGHEITSVIGQEITTPHLGHFNAFPLERDAEHRRGGALDWARGDDYDMTPAEIFQWVDEQDGDPDNAEIKQINHPSSTIPPLKADVLRGITLADPAKKRLDPNQPNASGEDTGLWSDDFTAIEMMNGHGKGRVWKVMRWWLSMISRGFAPTATAVTDTHKLYSDLGGSPRTFVFVGDEYDTPETFDAQAFAAASNANKAVGTNGPFFRVELENSNGDVVGLGETLSATDGEVTAHITIDVPEWMDVHTVDVYTNLAAEDIVTAPGGEIEDPLAPTSSHPIGWTEGTDLVEAAAGDASHKHWTKTVDIPLIVDADAYMVFVVRGSDNMWPVVPNSGVAPFAFSNPAFVDYDGNGYDNPPLAELAETPLEPMMFQKVMPAPFEGELTPEKLGEFIEAVGHKH